MRGYVGPAFLAASLICANAAYADEVAARTEGQQTTGSIRSIRFPAPDQPDDIKAPVRRVAFSPSM